MIQEQRELIAACTLTLTRTEDSYFTITGPADNIDLLRRMGVVTTVNGTDTINMFHHFDALDLYCQQQEATVAA